MTAAMHRRGYLVGTVSALIILAGCGSEATDDRRLEQFLSLCQKPQANAGVTEQSAGADRSDAQDPVVVEVSDSQSLSSALADSRAGQRIFMASGTYEGPFDITSQGTQEQPIVLCAEPGATVMGTSGDYALHLDGAKWWSIQGLRIANAKKGVVMDETDHSSLVALEVTGIDQEAVHLRTNSSDNTVIGLRVWDTGRTDPKFGEGVYVGSAVSNWCRYTDCSPDRSDRNRIIGNAFGPDVRSENIDIKEGTTGGEISGNRFTGEGATDADSWVDVKGNAWVISSNTGVSAPEDGMAVRVEAEGWGNDNQFVANSMDIDASGYGIWVDSDATGTLIDCDNTARGAQSGLSNVRCLD